MARPGLLSAHGPREVISESPGIWRPRRACYPGSWPGLTSACLCFLLSPHLGPWKFLEAERNNGCCQVPPHSISFILRLGSLGFASPVPRAVLCWLPLCCVSASTGKGLAPLQVSQLQSPSLGGILGWWKSRGSLRNVLLTHLLRVVFGTILGSVG